MLAHWLSAHRLSVYNEGFLQDFLMEVGKNYVCGATPPRVCGGVVL